MEGRLVEQVGRDLNSIGETHNRGIHPLACSFVFPFVQLEPTQISPIFILLICPSFTLFGINFSMGSRLLWHMRESVAASPDVSQHAGTAKSFPVTRK